MLYYILIIIVFLFIFLFIKNKEQFKSDYSDYNNIDRIKIHNFDTIDVNNKYAMNQNKDDTFAYCIGATPRCETGAPIKIGVYQNGNTYKSICDDGSNIKCKNFMSTTDSNIWTTPNNTKIMFSETYKGFTEPTSYIPAVINNNLINFYNKNNNVLDSIDKCSILGSEKNNCNKALNVPFPFADKKTQISYQYKYRDTNVSGVYDANAINASSGYIVDKENEIGTFISYTEKTPKSNGKTGMYPSLPCIADYGSQPGDNVCNGEIGLIQDDTLICPYYKPICQGYMCDSNFGKCTYSK
jgi:hypothetical protein